MILHDYDSITGEYLGSSKAQANPKAEGEFLPRANATDKKLPSYGDGEKPVFKNNKWVVLKDYRGKTAYNANDRDDLYIVRDLGDLQDGFVLEQPELVLSDDEKWEQVRQKRNNLLAQSDWTVLIDSPLTDEKKQEYITYRQALRDLPSKYNNPDNVVYPDQPEV
jgi:hypothetical protein